MRFTALFLLNLMLLEALSAESWKVYKTQKPAKGSLLPVELSLQIKESFPKDVKDKNFLSAEVYLFDSAGLFESGIKYLTPVGGGTIDLAQVLPEGKAKFSVRMNLSDESGQSVSPDQVFFVPGISYLKNGEEIHCGKYYDVTSFFISELGTEKGHETYLSRGIYADVLLGSFIFVKKYEREKKVSLGNVNFIDGRFAGRSCFKESTKE